MKYIFDFDDVLFYNTEQFKKHMYLCLENIGIPYDIAREHYKEIRESYDNGFTLEKFISSLLTNRKMNEINVKELSEKIMGESKKFINAELIELVKKLGKNNCYVVTHGNKEYQLEKIKRIGIADLFSKIITVQESKKNAVEEICALHKNEEVIFIDDKAKRFADLDFEKCPNLKTILYIGQSAEKLMEEFSV